MVDPDMQGQLIPPFLNERRELIAAMSPGHMPSSHSRLARRLLLNAGDALIRFGTVMKRHGHVELAHPTAIVAMETK